MVLTTAFGLEICLEGTSVRVTNVLIAYFVLRSELTEYAVRNTPDAHAALFT